MSADDLTRLAELNTDYVAAVQAGDVERFEELLAADFRCSNPDGSIVDKTGFLAQTARPVTIRNLEAHQVEIRLFGDTAIVHAQTQYRTSAGEPRHGRYTSVWIRHPPGWKAVAAQVMR
jgi:ketosteroid isomerase-like protein